jgi:hypothetical protein
MRARSAVATTLLAALAGCASCDSVPSSAVTDCNAQVVPGAAKVDLLLVVDDSQSMNPYQAELAQNLATFIDQLLASAIAIDLQIGVTNTSVAEGGATVDAEGTTTYATGGGAGPSAGVPYPRGSVVAVLDPDGVVTAGLFAYGPARYGTVHGGWGGQRVLSSSALSAADLKRFFKANVRQGRWGSGKEQPLRALRMAIDQAHRAGGTNLGLLRDGARLAVVILTDEDDCSQSAGPFLTSSQENSNTNPGCHNGTYKFATGAGALDPLSDFVTLLDSTVGSAPIVAVVSGFDPNTLDPVGCTTRINGTNTTTFDTPDRLDEFLTMLGSTHPGRTFKDSICSDFGPALTRIASILIPQTMPLEQAPEDYRMMVVSVQRGSTQIPCHMEPSSASASAVSAADVVYRPAPPGGLASLTFQNACLLKPGDKVNVQILCAK